MTKETYWGIWPEHTLRELEALPTLTQGQADDLKWESDTRRVWLSRCDVADGEPWDNKVTVEVLVAGDWIEVEWWEAKNPFVFRVTGVEDNTASRRNYDVPYDETFTISAQTAESVGDALNELINRSGMWESLDMHRGFEIQFLPEGKPA